MSRDVHSCSYWLRPRNPPPPHLSSYTRGALGQPRKTTSPCNPLPSTYQHCGIGACGGEKHQPFPIRSQTKPWPFPFQPTQAAHYLPILSLSFSSHLTGPGCGRLQRITRKYGAATQPLPSWHRLLLAQQGSWGQAASLVIHSLWCGNFFWEHVLPRYDPSSVGSRHRWHAHQKYHFLLHSTGESVFLDLQLPVLDFFLYYNFVFFVLYEL